MAELKEYKTKINGLETTLQLTEKDAKARGLVASDDADDAVETKAAKAPANKARATTATKA